MKCTIFYSWQSDLPNKDNRSFIESCIQKAVKMDKLGLDIAISIAVDRDTRETVGTPDIAGTIFDKIAKADIFICDISIINGEYNGRKCPNPNVLLELGYAVRTIGWERIICFYNTKYGDIKDIPFDLSHRRIFGYNSDKDNEKQTVTKGLSSGIKAMIAKGMISNPLRDRMKGKIDYCILEILKQICCVLYGTITMSDALGKVNDVLKLERISIMEIVDSKYKVLGFFAYNDLEEIKVKSETVLSAITSSNVYPVEWAIVVLRLVDWIRRYQYIISARAKNQLYRSVLEPVSYLDVISAKGMNPNNPENSYVLTKKFGHGKGQVLYVGTMPFIEKSKLLSPWYINEDAKEAFVSCIADMIEIANDWLNENEGEFVLDPDFYMVH